MSRISKKKRALLTAAITSLVLVAVAVAFYSTAGSGDGSGTNADGYESELAITSEDADGVVPGADGKIQITGNINNPNPGSAEVNDLAGDVVDVTGDTPDTCDEDWFTIDNVSVADGTVIEAGADLPFTADLTMTDLTETDQNSCKSAVLDIDWTSGLGS